MVDVTPISEWECSPTPCSPSSRTRSGPHGPEGFQQGTNADHNPCWWPVNPYRSSPGPADGQDPR